MPVSEGWIRESRSEDAFDGSARKNGNPFWDKQQAGLRAKPMPLEVASYACQRPTPMNHHNKHVSGKIGEVVKIGVGRRVLGGGGGGLV